MTISLKSIITNFVSKAINQCSQFNHSFFHSQKSFILNRKNPLFMLPKPDEFGKFFVLFPLSMKSHQLRILDLPTEKMKIVFSLFTKQRV